MLSPRPVRATFCTYKKAPGFRPDPCAVKAVMPWFCPLNHESYPSQCLNRCSS
jgi:hypothetical protein